MIKILLNNLRSKPGFDAVQNLLRIIDLAIELKFDKLHQLMMRTADFEEPGNCPLDQMFNMSCDPLTIKYLSSKFESFLLKVQKSLIVCKFKVYLIKEIHVNL